MNQKELENLVNRSVEIPFTIHMTDGTSYDVRNAAMIAVGKHTAIVLTPNGDEEVDTYEHLSIIHIVRAEQKVARSG